MLMVICPLTDTMHVFNSLHKPQSPPRYKLLLDFNIFTLSPFCNVYYIYDIYNSSSVYKSLNLWELFGDFNRVSYK